LQEYLGVPNEISGYHIRIRNPDNASRVGMELAAETGLLAYSWQSLFSGLIEQLKLQKALIAVVVFLIVLVAAMGIANILILTVAEKTEEIAILKAMGASQRQIISTFTLEGLILGGTGTLLGALLGFSISLYFKLKPFPLPGDLYFITALPVDMQAFDFIWVCALSLATSVIAGIVPARRASGLNPVDILR
ncbi:MAG: ABC transporter permease, partial [Trueperaceae bacterium]|nr:ABC transporter permease [Trueperaceae bacterium]